MEEYTKAIKPTQQQCPYQQPAQGSHINFRNNEQKHGKSNFFQKLKLRLQFVIAIKIYMSMEAYEWKCPHVQTTLLLQRLLRAANPKPKPVVPINIGPAVKNYHEPKVCCSYYHRDFKKLRKSIRNKAIKFKLKLQHLEPRLL